jgi:hypothetical protein
VNSLILRTATRFLVTLLLLFSVFLLLRGHNEPAAGCRRPGRGGGLYPLRPGV